MTAPVAPSAFQSLGLAVTAYLPLAITGGALQQSETLQHHIVSYRHSIAAAGGYTSAEITIADTRAGLERLLDFPLGRHIETNDSAERVWEGFVNRFSLNIGPLSIAIGPLTDIGNRVSAVYTLIDTSTNPPTQLGKTVTTLADDTASQAKYGIWEKVLTLGQCTQADAEQARDTFLAAKAWPVISQQVNILPSGQPSATLSCLGYSAWFGAYVYTQTTVSGTESLTTRVLNILTADPNNIFSADTSLVKSNAFLIPAYENNEAFANALLADVIAYGDASANRWTLGVYDDRRVSYAQAPATQEYAKRVHDNGDIRLVGGARVRPWRVRPGKWYMLEDFAPGRVPPGTSLAEDIRAGFIETCDFTAPYGLTLNGTRIDTLGQILAQIAGGGINP